MNQKYIDMVYSENHLEHHGILGQKWGVENGPPYPLGRDVQSELSNGASYSSLNKAIKSDYKAENKNYEKSEEYINNRETYLKKNINDDDIKRIKNAISNYEETDLEAAKLETGNGRLTDEMKKAYERRDNAYRELENITRELENKKLGDNKDTLLYMALDDKIPEKSADTAKKERLNKALKIAGVAAGVAAVAGVSYLAAKEVSKTLDGHDGNNGFFGKGIGEFNRANIAEKIAKDKTSAKGWHEGIQDSLDARRRLANNEYHQGITILEDRGRNRASTKNAIQELYKEKTELVSKRTTGENKRIHSMANLDSSKSIRDKAATKLLEKYENNAYKSAQKYSNTRKEDLNLAKDRAQVDRAQVGRAQVDRASVDRDSKNKKSKR